MDKRKTVSGSVFPYKLSEGNRQMIIEMFEASGSTTHSGQGQTLGVVLEHCLKNKIEFKLYSRKGKGFLMRRLS